MLHTELIRIENLGFAFILNYIYLRKQSGDNWPCLLKCHSVV